MSNMSYCRFENTAKDLEDCVDALEEVEGDITKLSKSEQRAFHKLLQLADNFSGDYEHLLPHL